jgi:two-component system phosphate regulon response regulator PhoB
MKIYLAENRSEVRSALKLVLEEAAGLKVNAEVNDSDELMDFIDFDCPDIILLDWDLRRISGPGLIRQIKDKYTRPVIISLTSEPETGKIAVNEGADGFICKTSLPQEVIATVIKCLEKKFPVYD